MLMLMHLERLCATSGQNPKHASIAWADEGKAFVIRDKAKLISKWLPIFFSEAKFSSFTRKLYRWGFRQVNLEGELQSKVFYFGNENFRRSDTSLLGRMRSVTAAGRRRELAAQEARGGTVPSVPSTIYTITGEEGMYSSLSPEICRLLQQGNHSIGTTAANTSSLPSLAHLVAGQTGPLGLGGGGLGAQTTMLQQASVQAQLQQQLLLQQLGAALQPQNPGPVATQQLLALSRLSEQQQQPLSHPTPQLGILEQLQQQQRTNVDQERLRAIVEALMGRRNNPGH
jgi:hypothetical protein